MSPPLKIPLNSTQYASENSIKLNAARLRLFFFTALIMTVFTAYANTEDGDAPALRDFEEKTIATMDSAVYIIALNNLQPSGNPVYYNSDLDMYNAVRNGRADACLDMKSNAMLYISMGNSDFKTIDIPDDIAQAKVCALGLNRKLLDDFNSFLNYIRKEGTLGDMINRWVYDLDPKERQTMPEIENSKTNGVITIATSNFMPYTFIENGELIGLNIELALRFGAYCGKEIQFKEMTSSGLIPSIAAGKSDLAMPELYTEEHAETFLFSEPYFVTPFVLMYVPKNNAIPASDENKSFGAWLKTAIQNNLIKENRWKLITNGLLTTLRIASFSLFFGTLLGCFMCYIFTRKVKIVKWVSSLFSEVIKNTPVLVLLMIFYYIIFGKSSIAPVTIAVIAFTLSQGNDIGSLLAASIQTVSITEIEAARAMGCPARTAFLHITLPQAIKTALPRWLNGFSGLLKSTSIVGYISIQDLTRAGNIIRARTYDAYFPLIFIALIYLLVAKILICLFNLVIRRVQQ